MRRECTQFHTEQIRLSESIDSAKGAVMKPAPHPPLYLLVAISSFSLGTMVDFPEQPDQQTHTHPTAESDRQKTDASPVSSSSHDFPADDQRPNRSRDVTASPETASGTASELRVDSGRSALEPSLSAPTGKVQTAPVLKTRFGDVSIFSPENDWNRDISALPVHETSSTWIRSIGLSDGLHPDFGTVWQGAPNGIPFVVVDSDQPKVPVRFEYDDESDPGPYPIPRGVPIEGGQDAPYDSDRHVIMIDPKRKLLYELFQAIPDPVFGWRAGSGAIFDLSTDRLRPDGWTSADAAGLPVFPGLVRFDEVASGEIRHALRFTVERTQRAYIHPARHFASRHNNPTLPPMGLRVRLRADYDISGFPRTAQVILTALKKYGMLLADNGSNWFLSGSPDPRWNDDDLATLKRVKGRDFECVYTGPLKK